MLLNERCPLNARIRTRTAELLILKKVEAIEIYSIYPNIWKRINKKSLYDMEQIYLKIQKTLIELSIKNDIKLLRNILAKSKNIIRNRQKQNNSNLFKNIYKHNDKNESKINKDTTKNNKNNNLNKIKLKKDDTSQNISFFKLNSLENDSIKYGDLSITKGLDKSTNSLLIKDINNNVKKKMNGNKIINTKNNNLIMNKSNDDDNKTNNSIENNIILNELKKMNNSKTNNSKNNIENDDNYINGEINNEIYQNENLNINTQKKYFIFPEVFPSNKNEESIENNNNNNLNESTTQYSPLKKILSKKGLISNNSNNEKICNNSFRNLCSTKENSIHLNSSYENINKISNYKYINNFILQNKTKEFIVDECEKNVSSIKKNNLVGRRHNSLINFHSIQLYGDKFNNNKINKKMSDKFFYNSNINSSKSIKKILKRKHQFEYNSNSKSEITSPIINQKRKVPKVVSFNNISNYTFIKTFSPVRNKKKIINRKSLIGKKLNVISKNIQNAKEAINNPNEFYMNFFSNILKRETVICSNIGEASKTKKTNNKLLNNLSSSIGPDNKFVNKNTKLDSNNVT